MSTSVNVSFKNTILFDLDGTVTDPKVGITKSVQYALRSFGIDVMDLESLCKFIGPPLKESFMKFYGFSEDTTCIAVEKYREYFKEAGMYENELYPGMKKLLKGLSTAGKQLMIATSKPKIFADRILEYFEISQYFQYVFGSELDGTRTHKDEVIRFALEQSETWDYTRVIMIGDREYDILGAKKVGVDAMGVLYGYGSYGELEKAGADLLVSSVAELGKVLLESKS